MKPDKAPFLPIMCKFYSKFLPIMCKMLACRIKMNGVALKCASGGAKSLEEMPNFPQNCTCSLTFSRYYSVMNFPMNNNYYGLTIDYARFLKAGIDANQHLSAWENIWKMRHIKPDSRPNRPRS